MYVYIKSERTLWTVGFYSPDGTLNPESDHANTEAAAERVHWLNGGHRQDNDNIGKKFYVEAPEFEGYATLLSVQDDDTARVQSTHSNKIFTVFKMNLLREVPQ